MILPLEAADGEEGKDDKTDLSGLSVLNVFSKEDEAVFACRYLEKAGASALPLESIEGAAAVLEANDIDVVVLPDEDSLEIWQLQSEYPDLVFVTLSSDRTASKGLVSPRMAAVESDPLPRASLLKAVGLACGRVVPESDADDTAVKKKVKAPTIEEARARGELLLIAEDNVTNQDVIRRQLAQLGYACEVASDGAEAFEAWKTGSFAALLTDCHMPNMDGYQLTQAIREVE